MKTKSTGICFSTQKLGEDYVGLTICENRCPMCSIAEDVKNFIAVLDSIGLMTKVLELSLKVEDLTNLADDVDFINNIVLVEE